MGRTSNPWGIAETRHRSVPGNGRKIHGEAPQAAIAYVEDLPGEPYQAVGVGRFFRGVDFELQDPARVRGPGT